LCKIDQLWWVKYYRGGSYFRLSTGTTEQANAKRFLSKRLTEIATGAFNGLEVERISIAELADGFLRDYKVNGCRSLDDVEARWRLRLQPFFASMRAASVTSDLIAHHVDERQRKGASTINRKLTALKRMYRLGAPLNSGSWPQNCDSITTIHGDCFYSSLLEDGFVVCADPISFDEWHLSEQLETMDCHKGGKFGKLTASFIGFEIGDFRFDVSHLREYRKGALKHKQFGALRINYQSPVTADIDMALIDQMGESRRCHTDLRREVNLGKHVSVLREFENGRRRA
jgi:hypothetical protein